MILSYLKNNTILSRIVLCLLSLGTHLGSMECFNITIQIHHQSVSSPPQSRCWHPPPTARHPASPTFLVSQGFSNCLLSSRRFSSMEGTWKRNTGRGGKPRQLVRWRLACGRRPGLTKQTPPHPTPNYGGALGGGQGREEKTQGHTCGQRALE